MPTPSKSELQKRLLALEQEQAFLKAQLSRWDESPDEGPVSVQAKDEVGPEVYILDKAEDGIFTLDKEGRFSYINASGSRMLGSDAEALMSLKLTDVLGEDGHRAWADEIRGWIQDTRKESPQLWLEISSRNKLGIQRWLNLNLSWSGNEGRVREEVHGVMRDITTQKRLELALRRSEEHYRGIIENMDLGILEVDQQERITRAFPKFCAMVGYHEEELLGKKASDVLMAPSERQEMETRTRARHAGESELYECVILNKQGEERWLLISGVPLKNEAGETVGSMGIHYDITGHKRDEERLKKAMRAADAARRAERRFLAKMSHEIRTPLNAILGMSHLLHETELSSEQDVFVQAISKGGTLLKELLDGVLNIARLEEGRKALDLKPAKVLPALEGIMAVYSTLLQKRGVELKLEWDKSLDGALLLDVQALSQVLLNLVGNAAKFTRRGSIVLRPRLMEVKGKLKLQVQVLDTGRGIPEELLPRVFDRFVQAHESSERLQQGSGLGLAICRELCALHGGSITATSTVGEGSEFTFEFAVERADLEEDDSSKRNPEPLQGMRVLCAEDNAVNLLYLQKLLKGWGVQMGSVGNGAEAVHSWKKGEWDLILMDVQMPVMSGFDATRSIRASETGEEHTPIVGLTAFAFEKDEEEGAQAGMDAYLKKPYAPHELMDVLLRWRLD